MAQARTAVVEEWAAVRWLRIHPQATRVPEMQADEFRGLLADVSERGILVPLEVNADRVVLDGRHRLRCARELGLEQVPVRVVSAENELSYMLRAALHRRQLSPSQRAALILEDEGLQNLEAEARARSRVNLKQNAEVATLPPRSERSRERAARQAGVSPRLIEYAKVVREGDPVLFERVKAGKLPAQRAAKQIERQRMLEGLQAPPPLPRGRFQLLYVDPPWPSASPGSEWSPEQHYPTLSIEEIKSLPLPAAEDALLFLWAVGPQLPQALEVMAAWGFEHRTQIVWVKPSIGLGFYVRHRHELLLIGRRGDFAIPNEADRPDSVVEAPRGRHSEKPACFYELLERMYPAASKLELFARRAPRPGWAAWGNEVAA
jgi:N6-adenosine-specific RNA methylase IME4/ParB-like chromosome segregation protein Spo0J